MFRILLDNGHETLGYTAARCAVIASASFSVTGSGGALCVRPESRPHRLPLQVDGAAGELHTARVILGPYASCTFEVNEREAPGRIEGDRVVEPSTPPRCALARSGRRRRRRPYPRRGAPQAAHPAQPPSVRDFYAFERHVATARAQRDWRWRPSTRTPPYFSNPAAIVGPDDDVAFPGGELRVGLRARGGRRHRSERRDRGLHRAERLVGPRPTEDGDGSRARPGQGQGLRHVHRSRACHARRARRSAARDGRSRERRGTLARERRRYAYWSWDDLAAQAGRNTKLSPATCWGRARSDQAASSSTGTAAGSSRATSSSWKSSTSASWRIACADDVSRTSKSRSSAAGSRGLRRRTRSRERRDRRLRAVPARSRARSSHGATRIFRLAYPDPDWIRLAQEALIGWGQLEVESGTQLLALVGLVELVRDLSESSQRRRRLCDVAC